MVYITAYALEFGTLGVSKVSSPYVLHMYRTYEGGGGSRHDDAASAAEADKTGGSGLKAAAQALKCNPKQWKRIFHLRLTTGGNALPAADLFAACFGEAVKLRQGLAENASAMVVSQPGQPEESGKSGKSGKAAEKAAFAAVGKVSREAFGSGLVAEKRRKQEEFVRQMEALCTALGGKIKGFDHEESDDY